MKDVAHHLRRVQRKIIRSSRQEANQPLNGKHLETVNKQSSEMISPAKKSSSGNF